MPSQINYLAHCLRLKSFFSLVKGYLNEGWVDPRKYLLAVRSKAKFLGVDFFDGKGLIFLLFYSNNLSI